MSRRKKQRQQEETLIDIYQAGEQAQDFFERNQTALLAGLFGIILLIGGVFAYNNFYKKPQMDEAIAQIAKAQEQFEKDSFALALSNPGDGFMGFLDIINDYSSTPTANIAKYYAGISYLHLGDYNNALDNLKSFDPVGDITPIMKHGALGDVYSELNQMDDAKSSYKKAIGAGENDVLEAFFIKKLAMLNEREGNTEASLELYKRLRDEYAKTGFAKDVDKYITRLEAN